MLIGVVINEDDPMLTLNIHPPIEKKEDV